MWAKLGPASYTDFHEFSASTVDPDPSFGKPFYSEDSEHQHAMKAL